LGALAFEPGWAVAVGASAAGSASLAALPTLRRARPGFLGGSGLAVPSWLPGASCAGVVPDTCARAALASLRLRRPDLAGFSGLSPAGSSVLGEGTGQAFTARTGSAGSGSDAAGFCGAADCGGPSFGRCPAAGGVGAVSAFGSGEPPAGAVVVDGVDGKRVLSLGEEMTGRGDLAAPFGAAADAGRDTGAVGLGPAAGTVGGCSDLGSTRLRVCGGDGGGLALRCGGGAAGRGAAGCAVSVAEAGTVARGSACFTVLRCWGPGLAGAGEDTAGSGVLLICGVCGRSATTPWL
jgi:hypothetical protein